ncbi:MAG: hypothetical protein KDA58_13375, partial [Planctomycetaceae bacterium]|nr:hypothetical protein [Planctomycetaceae bacterium]
DKEQWSIGVSHAGFHWPEKLTDEDRTKSAEQLEHALRWALRRFVDESWIEDRLQANPASPSPESKPNDLESCPPGETS